MDNTNQKQLLDKVRERFRADKKLAQFLPMLDEYIFPDSMLIQLAEKSQDAVFRFCAAVDE